MTGVELAILGSAIAVIAVIFAVEYVRGRGGLATLPASMRLALRIALGIAFAILGVIGAFLPVLQGWLVFLLSALVLFPESRFAVKSLNKVEHRMPRLVSRLRRWGIGVPK